MQPFAKSTVQPKTDTGKDVLREFPRIAFQFFDLLDKNRLIKRHDKIDQLLVTSVTSSKDQYLYIFLLLHGKTTISHHQINTIAISSTQYNLNFMQVVDYCRSYNHYWFTNVYMLLLPMHEMSKLVYYIQERKD